MRIIDLGKHPELALLLGIPPAFPDPRESLRDLLLGGAPIMKTKSSTARPSRTKEARRSKRKQERNARRRNRR